MNPEENKTPDASSSSSSKIKNNISPKYNSILSLQKDKTQPTAGKNKIDELLEKEKQSNKLDSWNKLDKMTKITKLITFAEKYGQENKLAEPEIAQLKQFFIGCLDQSKLHKSKDVIYDRDSMEIREIPALFLHPVHRNFTLRITDNKRVSTLKSLAPKKSPAPAPLPVSTVKVDQPSSTDTI